MTGTLQSTGTVQSHVRRDLLKLYLAIVGPWVAWFGYQIFNTFPYSPVWYYVSVLLPLGGLILFLAIVWVVAGVRKLALGANEARPAQEAGDRSPHSETNPKRSPILETDASSRETPVSPEVETIFKKLDRLMDDEKAQIDGLPDSFRSEVLSGADCDEIAGATGEFGRDPQNPIPVNGPLGEMIYLSSLRTVTSQKIMFHRLGSIRNVDAFETVSFDGAVWDIFFFDLYHPRKSRRAPTAYRIAAGAERDRFLLGANEFVASFPDQLPDAISNTNGRLFNTRMRPRQVREAIDRIIFKRPADYQMRLNSVMAMLEAKAATKPLTEFCSRITEHQLQNEIERLDKSDLSKPGNILFMSIAMAAGNFWNQTLKYDNLDSSFAATNSDIVIVEALYWVWCLIGKMMFTDFNAALVVAETDERGAEVPKTEMDNRFALRTALGLMDAQIEAKTGWDVENVKASRLKEYCDIQDTDKLIGALTSRVLSSIGKQSIHDEDTDSFGPFAMEDKTLNIAITIWLRHLPARIFDMVG
jgi:hypothetical protein